MLLQDMYVFTIQKIAERESQCFDMHSGIFFEARTNDKT